MRKGLVNYCHGVSTVIVLLLLLSFIIYDTHFRIFCVYIVDSTLIDTDVQKLDDGRLQW